MFVCSSRQKQNLSGTNAENNYRSVSGVGGWGGKCTCPDGKEYIVGDNNDACKSLACEGGKAGPCTKDGASSAGKTGFKVTCANANIYQPASGVGGWGGKCTCPDGQEYIVGDNNDACKSLACAGGMAGPCTKDGASSAGKAGFKVTCAHANIYQPASGVGGWGGKCTCPDGQQYIVGDKNDACKSLACEGGKAGACTVGGASSYGKAGWKATCAPGPVVLFDGLNFTGAAVVIDKEGTYNYCKKTLAKNDSIQSVFVTHGWKVTLFQHCAGETPNQKLVLTSSKSDLGAMNAQASIVKVEKLGPVVLYDGLNWTGKATVIHKEGTYDYCQKTLKKNDSIQSVHVALGWKVTLLKHCHGETPNPTLVLTESTANLGDMNKQTSVVKVEKIDNVYQQASGVGGWGGKCVCPDGKEYIVGDNNDACKSLACVGGKAGACTVNGASNASKAGWKVTCAP